MKKLCVETCSFFPFRALGSRGRLGMKMRGISRTQSNCRKNVLQFSTFAHAAVGRRVGENRREPHQQNLR